MTKAILAFEDGTVFEGVSVGASGSTTGEAVFNTAMTGYQEILTDPSYTGQVVTLTYPHIGNTGVNGFDQESLGTHAAGLVIREVPRNPSNWRSEQSLQDWLVKHGMIAIAEVDTRAITRRLRDHGAQTVTIAAGDDVNAEAAIEAARKHPSMKGQSLAKDVSVQDTQTWTEAQINLNNGSVEAPNPVHHVVVLDYGVKHNILRMLSERACKVTVMPFNSSFEAVNAQQPDGVLVSNGPGDPDTMPEVIELLKQLIDSGIPTFGICLGHQMLGLALGGQTIKMKFGHHGGNHPVQDLDSGKVMITSQNHGFAIDEQTLGDHVRVTHRSLFDGSNQGIAINGKPVFSFQGHPEAGPGPHDMAYLFDQFVTMMTATQA